MSFYYCFDIKDVQIECGKEINETFTFIMIIIYY